MPSVAVVGAPRVCHGGHVRQGEGRLVAVRPAVVVGDRQRQLDGAVVGAGDGRILGAGSLNEQVAPGSTLVPTYCHDQVWVSLVPASVTEPFS